MKHDLDQHGQFIAAFAGEEFGNGWAFDKLFGGVDPGQKERDDVLAEAAARAIAADRDRIVGGGLVGGNERGLDEVRTAAQAVAQPAKGGAAADGVEDVVRAVVTLAAAEATAVGQVRDLGFG